jgi:hypothetical protein
MYTTLSSEARLKAILAVQLRLQQGEHPDDAVRFLLREGLPAADARETVDNLVAASRRENRGRGLLWLGLSVLCFAISAPFVAAVINGLQEGDLEGRGFGTSMVQAGTLPALLILAGCWLSWRGLRLLVGRRYSGNPD